MDARKIIRDFYHHFEKMDQEALVQMFAPHAMIDSPTLGKKEPQPFYRELFSKSKRIKVILKDIFVNPDKPHRAAVYTNFTWETKNGDTHTYEGVVIFEMTQQGKIQHIQIIYDAHLAREALRRAG